MPAFPDLEMLQALVCDSGAQAGIAEMFAGYADGLADLFRDRQLPKLKVALRALLLLTEAVGAVEAKAGGVA